MRQFGPATMVANLLNFGRVAVLEMFVPSTFRRRPYRKGLVTTMPFRCRLFRCRLSGNSPFHATITPVNRTPVNRGEPRRELDRPS